MYAATRSWSASHADLKSPIVSPRDAIYSTTPLVVVLHCFFNF